MEPLLGFDPGTLLGSGTEGWTREERRAYSRALEDSPLAWAQRLPQDEPPLAPSQSPPPPRPRRRRRRPGGTSPALVPAEEPVPPRPAYVAAVTAAEQTVRELMRRSDDAGGDEALRGAIRYAFAEIGRMREVLLSPYSP
jgi:hypothetical protein